MSSFQYALVMLIQQLEPATYEYNPYVKGTTSPVMHDNSGENIISEHK